LVVQEVSDEHRIAAVVGKRRNPVGLRAHDGTVPALAALGGGNSEIHVSRGAQLLGCQAIRCLARRAREGAGIERASARIGDLLIDDAVLRVARRGCAGRVIIARFSADSTGGWSSTGTCECPVQISDSSVSP